MIRLFDKLEWTESEDSGSCYVAFRIPDRPEDFIAKGRDGQPVVLFSMPATCISVCPNIHLEHITVDHALVCRVLIGDAETKQGVFSLIRLISSDRQTQELFLRLIYPIVQLLPIRPTYKELDIAINSVLELLRRLKQPNKKTVQGLWAELLMISSAKNPLVLAEAWHDDPADIYDFSLNDLRIEVKSSVDSARLHFFSYEQLHPPEGVRAIIASVTVEEFAEGVGIYELLDIVYARLTDHPEALNKVNLIIADTIGAAWKRAIDAKFNLDHAILSIKYYDSTSIPSIAGPIPIGVSQVKFKSDLTFCEPLAVQDLGEANGLVDILPR